MYTCVCVCVCVLRGARILLRYWFLLLELEMDPQNCQWEVDKEQETGWGVTQFARGGSTRALKALWRLHLKILKTLLTQLRSWWFWLSQSCPVWNSGTQEDFFSLLLPLLLPLLRARWREGFKKKNYSPDPVEWLWKAFNQCTRTICRAVVHVEWGSLSHSLSLWYDPIDVDSLTQHPTWRPDDWDSASSLHWHLPLFECFYWRWHAA